MCLFQFGFLQQWDCWLYGCLFFFLNIYLFIFGCAGVVAAMV